MRTVLALLLAVAATGPAAAQPGGERLDLVGAVERALGRYPSVAAARAANAGAQAEVAAAAAALLPAARLASSATRFERPMVVSPIHGFTPGSFPQFDRTLFQTEIDVTYTLFDGGARAARIRQAAAQAAGAAAALDAAQQDLAARVATVYLDVLDREQELAAHDQRLEALQAELDRVGKLFAVGRAAQVDVLRAEAALASAEAERTRRATALDDAERDLARLLDAGVEEVRAPRLAPVQPGAGAPLPREAIVERARAASPAVTRAEREVAAARAARALAQSRLFPALELGGGLTDWASGAGHAETDWSAALRLSFRLFDGGESRSRLAAAEAAATVAEERLRLAGIEVSERVDRAYAGWTEARARAESLGKAGERFAEVVRIQKLLLESGAGTQIDYLGAQADLLAARADLAAAVRAMLVARVALAHAAGELDLSWLRTNLGARP
jgi:outer membrane protein TolC